MDDIYEISYGYGNDLRHTLEIQTMSQNKGNI